MIYVLGVALYNVTLHPLAKFPGPKLRGAFYVPAFWEIYTGESVRNWKVLHDVYGEVVRITPTTLSFNSKAAWQGVNRPLLALDTTLPDMSIKIYMARMGEENPSLRIRTSISLAMTGFQISPVSSTAMLTNVTRR